MRYSLFLKDFEIHVSIGIHDEERAAPQRVLVNFVFVVEVEKLNDDINSVIDYDVLKLRARQIAESKHFDLQETFCSELVSVFHDYDSVIAARVSTEKPDVFPDAASVGCRMLWIRDQDLFGKFDPFLFN